MTDRHYLPALRGRFGDWAYYCTLMTLRQIAARVDYAKDIHKNRTLSEMIQRELTLGRAGEIANYIHANQDRFFNSLVVAVYGGKPQWHPFDVKPTAADISVDDLDETARDSVGYLSLTDEDRVFALDGQHRLAGIKQALDEDPLLAEQELSVIFVAHGTTVEGMQRTRKLFTTLNKQAKPVNKSEIIALDESDVVAIVTRDLVENQQYFNDGQVDMLSKQANLAHGDIEHFTTIINLYDTLHLLLLIHKGLSPAKATEFKANRPKDEEIKSFIDYATAFYSRMGELFPILGRYFTAAQPGKRRVILKSMRSPENGHVLFRPIGMLIFSQILKALIPKLSFQEGMGLLAALPTGLHEPPYLGTVWNPIAKTVQNNKMSLCRDVLLHMISHRRGSSEKLLKRYATALGKQPIDVSLPDPIV